MMSSTTPIIHPLLYKGRFDLLRDFAPVSQVSQQGYILTIHPSIPAKTVLEFVKFLKANPDKLNFASSGIGSPIHMSGELFQLATGTKMIHSAFGIAPGLYPKLPYDVLRDFAPISNVATQAQVLVAGAASPVKTVGDLVKLARAKPGTLNYASVGPGTATHLSMKRLRASRR